MRAWFVIGSTALVAAACAATGADRSDAPPEPDAGTNVPPSTDGGSPEDDAATDAMDGAIAPPEDTTCSKAGWCRTAIPDPDLVITDFWPLDGRVFAIAQSPTLGVKILEWADADAKWTYVDDGSQNEDGRGRWAGKIWAPSENEIYAGVSPNWIFHGTRTAPGSPWSWSASQLGTSNAADLYDGYPSYTPPLAQQGRLPALGVWGTSSSDVYAWFNNRIYHWASVDGGEHEWVPEHVAADTENSMERMHFVAADGASPGEVWFSGTRARGRSACALLVRRTSAGYERIADGITATLNRACTARPGALFIGGKDGWLTDLHVTSVDELRGLKGGRDAVKIVRDGESYSVSLAPIPESVNGDATYGLNSLSIVEGELWLGGEGVVIRGDDVWDGGAYAISPIAWSPTVTTVPMIYRVRGISTKNLWAMGYRHALHKTTP